MGDRTSVTLTVLIEQAAEAEKLFTFGSDYGYANEKFAMYDFNEVNYGNLPFLNELMHAGIAFDSEWGSGSEYGPGIHFCRFDAQGLIHANEVSDEGQNPPLGELIKRIDDHNALRQYILEYKRDVTPLPWDNQIEYGKIHRALMLITPKE